MWPFCSETSPLWSAVPALIGLLTGWWAWGRRIATRQPVHIQPQAPPPQPRMAPVQPQAPDRAPVAPLRAADAPHLWVADLETAALTAASAPAAIGPPDDLTQLKGIGPKLNALLAGLGVTRFEQIARWGEEEIAKIDVHLGAFRGRIVRDRWVEQAGLLARGATEEFEARFGQLDGGEA